MTPQERFNQLTVGLKIKQIDSSNILFGNSEVDLFDYDLKSNYLWCSYEYVWSIFQKEYSLNYVDIQSLIKSMVENPLKLGEVTPDLQ